MEKIIKQAKKYVGITEYPANSNNVLFNSAFYGKDVSGSAYPWCCTFVWYVCKEAGVNIKKTASCMVLGDWFKSQGKFKTKNPQPGDVVFFKFSGNSRWTNHVGIVTEVYSDGSIKTIEGNTSPTEKGSQANGGMVAERKRKSNIVGYGSLVSHPTLRRGSRGESVKLMQELLVKKSSAPIDCDGIFGPVTEVYLVNYQALKGLKKDGICGPVTWTSLLS